MRSRRGHIHITPVENHSILTSRGTKSSINDSRKTTKDLIACHFKEKFKDKDNSGNCVLITKTELVMYLLTIRTNVEF